MIKGNETSLVIWSFLKLFKWILETISPISSLWTESELTCGRGGHSIPGQTVPLYAHVCFHFYVMIKGMRRAWLLAHLSWRLTRWAYRLGLEPASVHPSVRASTLSNMNISETSRPITTKFYLKHHWGRGKAALGFDADQIRTLVSMATDSSHRVIMGKRASSLFLDCFWSDPFYTCR